MIIRLCKISLVATIALFFGLVAIENVTDYGTNWVFVQHVLAMDTVFPTTTLKWRAITDERIAAAAYWLIIFWEMLVAAILAAASARLLATSSDPRRFVEAKPMAVVGLTCGLLLYGLGFTTIGGEWFMMWQSTTWNSLDSSARFTLLEGLVLLVLLAPEAQ
jgi:predicted small integral membrane protein